MRSRGEYVFGTAVDQHGVVHRMERESRVSEPSWKWCDGDLGVVSKTFQAGDARPVTCIWCVTGMWGGS